MCTYCKCCSKHSVFSTDWISLDWLFCLHFPRFFATASFFMRVLVGFTVTWRWGGVKDGWGGSFLSALAWLAVSLLFLFDMDHTFLITEQYWFLLHLNSVPMKFRHFQLEKCESLRTLLFCGIIVLTFVLCVYSWNFIIASYCEEDCQHLLWKMWFITLVIRCAHLFCTFICVYMYCMYMYVRMCAYICIWVYIQNVCTFSQMYILKWQNKLICTVGHNSLQNGDYCCLT